MKRFLIFCLVVVISSSLAQAGVLIEAKGIYFQHSDKNLKKIYDGKCISYGGEIDIALWKGIGIWAGGSYLSKKGKMSFSGGETKIQITPVYGGIKLRLSPSNVSPYLGFGIGYFQYKEENEIGTIDGAGIGYIGQIGLIFKVGVMIIDFQAGYTTCRVKPLDIEANLGGFQGGIGLGFEF